jgi:intracellular septation protein
MQVMLILLPLAAFLLAYLWAGIYVATGVLMVAMTLLVLVDYLRLRSVSKMHALATVLVLVFGTATLAFRNPLFLQLKSTILFWLLALAFLASQWIGAAPFAQRMLEPTIRGGTVIERTVWLRMNLMWVGAYLLLGLVNLLVVHIASLQAYVYFYVYFKIIGLAIAFALALGQALWLQRRSVAT